MIKKFRKKPVVIEAVQFTGTNRKEIEKFTGQVLFFHAIETNREGVDLEFIRIRTLEGVYEGKPMDYIIKGVAGEFYPCKPNSFEKTYEEVND